MPEGAYGGGTGCTEVVINGQNCVHCPAVEAVEGVPGYIDVERLFGWNASAYSTAAYDGNCYTQFDIPSALGAVVGLAPERLSNDPRDVPFGFYIYRSAGKEWYVVTEFGQPKTAPVAHLAADVFRIERFNSVVAYFVNGVHIRSATLRSYGALHVVSCLYASDDTVS